MDLQLIRNATLRLRFAGVEFLIDPMLGVKGSIRAMGDSTERNPTVDLPCPIADVLEGVDVVLVSHMHPDHFDEAAFGVVPRDVPVFCQPGDIDKLTAAGFSCTALEGPTRIGGVEITPVVASHGAGPIVERMGSVLGLVFRAEDEPTLYWAGDTILFDSVRDTLSAVQPKVIVTHSGGATAAGQTIIMDVADTLEVAQTAPSATVIAVHLEAVGHAPVTRQGLRQAANAAGIDSTQLRIPGDGETITVKLA